jgi:hypothetical protein
VFELQTDQHSQQKAVYWTEFRIVGGVRNSARQVGGKIKRQVAKALALLLWVSNRAVLRMRFTYTRETLSDCLRKPSFLKFNLHVRIPRIMKVLFYVVVVRSFFGYAFINCNTYARSRMKNISNKYDGLKFYSYI